MSHFNPSSFGYEMNLQATASLTEEGTGRTKYILWGTSTYRYMCVRIDTCKCVHALEHSSTHAYICMLILTCTHGLVYWHTQHTACSS